MLPSFLANNFFRSINEKFHNYDSFLFKTCYTSVQIFIIIKLLNFSSKTHKNFSDNYCLHYWSYEKKRFLVPYRFLKRFFLPEAKIITCGPI